MKIKGELLVLVLHGMVILWVGEAYQLMFVTLIIII